MVYKNKASGYYYVDLRRQGYPRLQLSTQTTAKKRAERMANTIQSLMNIARRDVLEALRARRHSLPAVHDAYEMGGIQAVEELLKPKNSHACQQRLKMAHFQRLKMAHFGVGSPTPEVI